MLKDITSLKRDYKIIRIIGRGNFGQVFWGQHKSGKHLVAIKAIKKDDERKDAIENELEVLSKVSH